MVPDLVTEIDQYFEDHAGDPRVAQLLEKRKMMNEKCEDILYRMCLVVALLVYATKFTPEAVGDTLCDLGFDVDVVRSRGIMDLEAVLRVTGGAFVIMLGLNALYALFVIGTGIQMAPAFAPGRETTLRFALVGILFYLLVLILVIKFKKYWRRDPELYRDRPENILVGAYCYLLILPINLILAYSFRGEFSVRSVLVCDKSGRHCILYRDVHRSVAHGNAGRLVVGGAAGLVPGRNDICCIPTFAADPWPHCFNRTACRRGLLLCPSDRCRRIPDRLPVPTFLSAHTAAPAEARSRRPDSSAPSRLNSTGTQFFAPMGQKLAVRALLRSAIFGNGGLPTTGRPPRIFRTAAFSTLRNGAFTIRRYPV